MKKINGFTLIELLVVIAIIGILSAIVLASLNGARLRSKDAKRLSDISQLQLALELFYDSCKRFPVAPLATGDNGGNNCPSGVTLSTFIDPLPKDPTTAAGYKYVVNGATPSNYHLGAALEVTAVIDRDRDFVSNAAPNSWTGGFNGATDNTCGQTLTYTPVKCYDVTGQ